MLKFSIQFLLLPFPWVVRRWILVSVLGFKLDPRSRIGLTIIFADEIEMAEGAFLGHFNYIGPCYDTAGRRSSANQEEGFHQTLYLLVP